MKFNLLVLVLVTSFAKGYGLHCFRHEHCGDNAVCVTSLASDTPRCLCLLGYTGNGARCTANDATEEDESRRSALGKGSRSVVIHKNCTTTTQSNVIDGNNVGEPDTTHHGDHHQEHNTHDSAHDAHPAGHDSDTDSDGHHGQHSPSGHSSGHPVHHAPAPGFPVSAASADQIGVPNTALCTLVTCDFTNNSACAYSNEKHSHWKIRTLSSGNSVAWVVGGNTSQVNYLLSSKFVLNEPSLLEFNYFESSSSTNHLRVSNNRVQNTIWVADVIGSGWRTGQVALSTGLQQIIFAAEQLSAKKLVAIDNIRLVDRSGQDGNCT